MHNMCMHMCMSMLSHVMLCMCMCMYVHVHVHVHVFLVHMYTLSSEDVIFVCTQPHKQGKAAERSLQFGGGWVGGGCWAVR